MSRLTLNLEIVRGTTFGPIQIICKNDAGQVVPLAGWKAYAEGRKTATSPVVIALNPSILNNDSTGLITIPEIAWEVTKTYDFQTLEWDLILETPQGKRLPPKLEGKIYVVNAKTQPA